MDSSSNPDAWREGLIAEINKLLRIAPERDLRLIYDFSKELIREK